MVPLEVDASNLHKRSRPTRVDERNTRIEHLKLDEPAPSLRDCNENFKAIGGWPGSACRTRLRADRARLRRLHRAPSVPGVDRLPAEAGCDPWVARRHGP